MAPGQCAFIPVETMNYRSVYLTKPSCGLPIRPRKRAVEPGQRYPVQAPTEPSCREPGQPLAQGQAKAAVSRIGSPRLAAEPSSASWRKYFGDDLAHREMFLNEQNLPVSCSKRLHAAQPDPHYESNAPSGMEKPTH
jgi:hypothetical protein